MKAAGEPMSQRLRIIVAGGIVGFLGAFTIWFAPGEPYANFIVAAGTLNGVLTALLITTMVDQHSSLSRAVGVGGVFGFALAATVFLAKGGWVSWDAPFVVPFGVIEGCVLGPIVRRLDALARH